MRSCFPNGACLSDFPITVVPLPLACYRTEYMPMVGIVVHAFKHNAQSSPTASPLSSPSSSHHGCCTRNTEWHTHPKKRSGRANLPLIMVALKFPPPSPPNQIITFRTIHPPSLSLIAHKLFNEPVGFGLSLVSLAHLPPSMPAAWTIHRVLDSPPWPLSRANRTRRTAWRPLTGSPAQPNRRELLGGGGGFWRCPRA
jgi:hypothetical protein